MKKLTYKNLEKIILYSLLLILMFFLLYYFIYEIDWVNIYKSQGEVKNISLLKESCLQCHGEVKGFSDFHDPGKIGCASCHLGNANENDKNNAHYGMVKIPGNANDAKKTCGRTNCHPGIPERIDSSLMSTMSGIISVNKYAFEEIDLPSGKYHIKDIGSSPADSHLRNLCASCHLGNPKNEFGPVNELSRGGGCNACHLNYSANALRELNQYDSLKIVSPDSALLKFHPSLSLKIDNTHCFGCHSRSGRISTNYEGWHETSLSGDEIKSDLSFRQLEDGRVFRKIEPDVHFEAGLVCVDCHISYEVMGDGKFYEHKEEQLLVECEDCHTHNFDRTMKLDEFDFESGKIAEIMDISDENTKFIKVRKSNTPLLNTFFEKGRTAKLKGKRSKQIYDLNPPKFDCVSASAHESLSCSSCHTAWAPQCVGCHTEYQPGTEGFDLLENNKTDSTWVEYHGEFFAELPTLGVTEKEVNGRIERKIGTFIPGMIMTLDKSNYKNTAPELLFKRLFAPASPHTISKESRSCESCHNDPLSIGYGRGDLQYVIHDGIARWVFRPEYNNSEFDNLPEDAWIGFLESAKTGNSTRINTRPFNLDEQKKILTVGSCLECHEPQSNVMKRSLTGYQDLLKILTPQCILPSWN